MSLGMACGQAIRQVGGRYVALVSNDSLVPEGWLNHLVALAKLRPEIGMVGTMSNLAPPPQWIGKLPYRLAYNPKQAAGDGRAAIDLAAFERFARDWRQTHMGESFEVERLGGSCVLLKAEVLQKVSLEQIPGPIGSIDGDLLSQAVIQAGYRLACCRDVFVHHLGTRMFVPLRVEPSKALEP